LLSAIVNCFAVRLAVTVVAGYFVGHGRKHTGARVFQERQEKERLPPFQFQEEIETYGMP